MKRATVCATHDDPETVVRALRPDDTAEMTTRVEGGQVVTTIERETTGGLRTTVDDHVVNLAVATDVVQVADQHTASNHE